MPSRTEKREDLLVAIGKFADPLERLVRSDEDVTKSVPFARIQHARDYTDITAIAQAYCATPGGFFAREAQVIVNNLSGFEPIFDMLLHKSKSHCQQEFDAIMDQTKRAVRAVPCEFDPVMLAAGSPFQAYRLLRTIFSSPKNRIDVFDPYLGAENYHRYFDEVPATVKISVVTDAKRLSGKDGKQIVSVSELFAIERSSHYRLIESPSLHDRHIRCDDEIFHLGGSLKDAAKKDPYTVTLVDPPGAVGTTLDQLMATGIEWFGPSTPKHRQVP